MDGASQDKKGRDVRSSDTTLPMCKNPRRQNRIMMGTTADTHLGMSCHSTQLTGLPPKPTAKGSDTLPLVSVSKEATQRHTSPMIPREINTPSGIMPAGTTQLIVQVGEKVDPLPKKCIKQNHSICLRKEKQMQIQQGNGCSHCFQTNPHCRPYCFMPLCFNAPSQFTQLCNSTLSFLV